MLITDQKFYCEEINTAIHGLSDIASTYANNGLSAAQKQLADYIRANMRADDYFKTPYYPRENAWYVSGEDDEAVCRRYAAGSVISCNFKHDFKDGVFDWNLNPTENGFPEWPWQLSRHHEWRCFAHRYQETGDEWYTEQYIRFFMSWIEQAPCPEQAQGCDSKCWRTLEAGLRMIKIWHYTFLSFYRSPLIDDHFIATYIKSIWEHGNRLVRSTSSANWLTSELVGLAHIGMLYPVLKKSDEWREFAFRRINEEADTQFYPDGFHYELTTGYHEVVCANYRYLFDTAEALGFELPETLRAKLEVMYDMYPKICSPDRRTPALNDGGKAGVAGPCAHAIEYFPERDDLRYFATNGKEGSLPKYTSAVLPYSGMAALRTDWSDKAIWFFMDSGPFGRGHQHEDKLNVLMYAYGKNVLEDTGSYDYDSSMMRKFVLDTASHNCAMVDDQNQRRRKGYRWLTEQIKERSNLKWSFSGAIDALEGYYDEGYGEELIPVTHNRKCIFFKQGVSGSLPFVLVIDRFVSCDGNDHKYAVSYQMNTQPFTVKDKTFTADFGEGVTMSVIGCIAPETVIAQKEPYYLGWRPRGGAGGTEREHYHAPCLRYTVFGKAGRVVTALYPSNNGTVDIKDIVISDNTSDPLITLVMRNGQSTVINENDYICTGDGETVFVPEV